MSQEVYQELNRLKGEKKTAILCVIGAIVMGGLGGGIFAALAITYPETRIESTIGFWALLWLIPLASWLSSALSHSDC